MSLVLEALRRGRCGRAEPPAVAEGGRPNAFDRGANWIRGVLVPSIEQANAELEPEGIAFKTDLNLSPRSTNHAHADFWATDVGGGAIGPKYSLNVIAGTDIRLYRDGSPGRVLGEIETCGPSHVEALLASAAEEFGRLLGGR